MRTYGDPPIPRCRSEEQVCDGGSGVGEVRCRDPMSGGIQKKKQERSKNKKPANQIVQITKHRDTASRKKFGHLPTSTRPFFFNSTLIGPSNRCGSHEHSVHSTNDDSAAMMAWIAIPTDSEVVSCLFYVADGSGGAPSSMSHHQQRSVLPTERSGT